MIFLFFKLGNKLFSLVPIVLIQPLLEDGGALVNISCLLLLSSGLNLEHFSQLLGFLSPGTGQDDDFFGREGGVLFCRGCAL